MIAKILAIMWSLLIIAVCSIPGSDLPGASFLWDFDKLGHFGVFMIFGWLWMRTSNKPQTLWFVLLGGILFGIGTEVYQGFLPWDRAPDVYDALADTAGLLAGIGAYRWWQRRRLGTS